MAFGLAQLTKMDDRFLNSYVKELFNDENIVLNSLINFETDSNIKEWLINLDI